MGYDRHHAIVVTTYSLERMVPAHAEAERLGLSCTPVIKSPVNAWLTFLVGPDGSMEGWDESDRGDERRDAFVAWLDAQRFGDGSCPYDWAEVQYGDDDGKTRIVRHSDERKRRKPGTLE